MTHGFKETLVNCWSFATTLDTVFSEHWIGNGEEGGNEEDLKKTSYRITSHWAWVWNFDPQNEKQNACTRNLTQRPMYFYVLLIVHLGMILANNKIDAQFFVYVYFYSLHVSGSHVPIIRRIIVPVRHLVYVTLCRWRSGMQPAYHINQVSHWCNNSPDDGHMAARNM